MCLTYRKSIEEDNTISWCYDTITHTSLFNTHQHHYINFLMPTLLFVKIYFYLDMGTYVCVGASRVLKRVSDPLKLEFT